MKRYMVIVQPIAIDQITAYADYIAEQSYSREISLAWVDRVYGAIQRLEYFPRRFTVADE